MLGTMVDPEEIHRLEEALSRRDLSALPGGPDAVLDDDFVEYGASGRSWDRASILAVLTTAPPVAATITEFKVVTLADGVVLATYRVSDGTPARTSLRSSIWIRRGDRWRVRFHQGTTVGE